MRVVITSPNYHHTICYSLKDSSKQDYHQSDSLESNMATSEPLEIQESLLKGFVHDHQSTYSSSEEELGQQRETSSSPSPFKRALPWLLHTIIFCVYTVVIFGYSSKPLKAFPTELREFNNTVTFMHYLISIQNP